MNLLFWNVKKNAIEKILFECLKENDIDVAIFAEHSNVDFDYIINRSDYVLISTKTGYEKTIMLVRNSIIAQVKRESSRYMIYQISNNNILYNIVGVHLQDRFTTESEVRKITICDLVHDLSNLERSSKCKRSIIIGDFNANPYDPEMLQINAFNAVLFKQVIEKSETRKLDGKPYRRFYNPILNYISESTNMYGSYYYTGNIASPIWHCLDQVIVSKALIDSIKNLKYLKCVGTKSLIKQIKPDESISDHLPLFVTID